MARREGIPRVYISVNSGARIGLAREVMECFRVAWNVPDNPAKGFRYLYLTPDDYNRLKAWNSVNAELVNEDGEVRSDTWLVESCALEQGGVVVPGFFEVAFCSIVSLCRCRSISCRQGTCAGHQDCGERTSPHLAQRRPASFPPSDHCIHVYSHTPRTGT